VCGPDKQTYSHPRPGPDGPNASGWYRRLREPISPLSLFNCDQLWQLFSRSWTILHSTIIHDLDSRITDKYSESKCHTSFYSMQFSFRFHSLGYSEILVSPSICTKILTWRFHRTEEVSNNFSVSWHITHMSMAISANLGRDTDHNSTKLVFSHPLRRNSSARNKISVFFWLKISNPRISSTVNGVRRSSWKVVWVTKWRYTSETSVKWQIFCPCSWQAINTC